MQIYREDSEIQEELAKRVMKQSRDRLLEDEVDNHLWKKGDDKDGKKDENNEGPIVVHGKIIGAEAVKNVQTLLSNGARTNGPVLPTYKRVAPRLDDSSFYINSGDGAIERTSALELQTSFKTPPLSVLYYALYDNQNRIVEITKAGWTIKFASDNLIFDINKKQHLLQKIHLGQYYRFSLKIVKYLKQSLQEHTLMTFLINLCNLPTSKMEMTSYW